MTELDELAVLPATTAPWHLVYQDDVLLVVNKPAMLLTVPGRHPANRDCLISRVQCEFPLAQVVHRLDYDTSGLLVLPLTKKALSAISIQFQQRQTKKFYQALVAGKCDEQGMIDSPIAADPLRRPLYKIADDGKPSQTLYRRLHFDGQNSRVQLEPVTGRSHQLRLHMASIGHPMLGDPFYAPATVLAQSPRLCLHAATLGFFHPQDGRWLEFSAEVPF